MVWMRSSFMASDLEEQKSRSHSPYYQEADANAYTVQGSLIEVPMEEGREDKTSNCDTRQKGPTCFQGALIGPPFQEYHSSSPAFSHRTITPLSRYYSFMACNRKVRRKDALIYAASQSILVPRNECDHRADTHTNDHWQSVDRQPLNRIRLFSLPYASGICHNPKRRGQSTQSVYCDRAASPLE
jgi:hypothetical protein